MTEIDQEIIKKTQITMGSLIKKPPLTEKLLLRPPLRFLHDICTSFMKATGLLEGLYTEDELNPDTMKDKENKLNFLNKLIDYVTIAHQHPLNVKSSSIIAGKECEKTNDLIVKLAECVNKVSDNQEIVTRALRGEAKTIKDKSLQKTRPKYTSKTDELTSQDRLVSSKPSVRRESVKEKAKPKSSKSVKQEVKQEMIMSEDPQPVKLQRPSSAKGNRKRKEGSKKASLKRKMEPVSAEESASLNAVQIPKIPTEEQQDRQSSITNITHHQTAQVPNGLKKRSSVRPSPYMESSDDENDEYMIEDFNGKSKRVDVSMAMPATEYSNVVKELEKAKDVFRKATSDEVRSLPADRELDDFTLDDAVCRRKRAASEKEVETIKNLLKNLCKSAQPFGKLMQDVHEELDSMQQDLEKWHAERINHESAAKTIRVSRPEDDTINSLKMQLIDSKSRIETYRENIRVAKSTVSANEERIKRLVGCACEDI